MVKLKKEQMTEMERWEALLNRQPVDRVPFALLAMGFSAVNVGYSKVKAYDDPEKSFWAQDWTNEMYGAAPFTWYFGGAFPAREFGGEAKMPEDEYSMAVSLLRPPVTSEEDVEKLTFPDVKSAGIIPLLMQFAQLQEKQGHRIILYLGGTLTRVGYMCEPSRMCKWMIKKPELVHRLCRLVTDLILELTAYWVKTFGAERIIGFNACPTESNQVISPKHFEEFALPYMKEVFDNAQAMGIKNIWTHICGEQNMNLPYWAQLSHGDPGIISIGQEIDIDDAARYFPNDIVFGNVDTTIIQFGTPQEVYEMTRQCIDKGKRCPGGFVLAPGCELPLQAPPYNVWTMRKAVNDLGWYEK
jgi:uroporphyrinogen decarboxylase